MNKPFPLITEKLLKPHLYSVQISSQSLVHWLQIVLHQSINQSVWIPRYSGCTCVKWTAFQITDGSWVNDPTVAALWPGRLSSGKPEIFVNFPCTWQSFPGHHCCCFTGCSQHHALESIYEWTLITSIWLSNSPHITTNQLSWFYKCGNPGQPHHDGGCSIYSRPTIHRKGKMSSFRHSYNCKCKHEVTIFFLMLITNIVLCFKLLSVSLVREWYGS